MDAKAINQRITLLVVALLAVTCIVMYRLILFQLVDWKEISDTGLNELIWPYEVIPDRGFILDHNGKTLAAPGNDYSVGIDIVQLYGIKDYEENGDVMFETIITELAQHLEMKRSDIVTRIEDAKNNPDLAFVQLNYRISPELKQQIEARFDALDLWSIKFDPVPRRQYPNDEFMCHVLGYVDYEGIGGNGVEAYYDRFLAGDAVLNEGSVVPHEGEDNALPRQGRHLKLTIERNLQYLVEEHLRNAVRDYEAEGGTIIVMDPNTGAMLAMANTPCYNPFVYHESTEDALWNKAVTDSYEPGSVIKLLTVAAAIDSGQVTPTTPFYDTGQVTIGGHQITNAAQETYGDVDVTRILMDSINTGTVWMASLMGPDTFYNYVERFGLGAKTGIDLAYETGGILNRPGDANWTEVSLGTNAFGQGINVTPIQVVSAVAAIANGGTMMRPYVLDSMYDGDVLVEKNEPEAVSQPISAETALQVNGMAVKTAANYAEMPGYTIAGKTGSAQVIEGGIYHPTEFIASFVGWLPADDPEFIMLVKLDRPKVGEWGSESALPAWLDLADELVVQLDIPPDAVRWATANR